MKNHSLAIVAGAALAILQFANPSSARDRNALNGTWTLIPARSDFAGQPVVQTGTVTIDERQGNITVSRNFTYEGANQTFFYKDTTDSQNNATIHDGKDIKSKTKWDHGVLKVITTERAGVTVESYALAPGGNLTATVVRPDHKQITLVFQRK